MHRSPMRPMTPARPPAQKAVRILGVDPGSVVTGIGIIDAVGNQLHHVAHFAIKTGDGDFNSRLQAIYEGVRQAVAEHQPQEVAVERVFMSRNVDSALKLGHARGAAIVAAGASCELSEYSPRSIKQALVGGGGADKKQVQHMVAMLLKLTPPLQADAADALAAAICHAHHRATNTRLAATTAALAARAGGR